VSAREAAVAVTRFGLGAAPGEIRAAGGDPRGWVLDQVGADATIDGNRLPTTGEVARELFDFRKSMRGQDRDRDDVRRFRQAIGSTYRDEMAARFHAAVESDAPFAERLVHFWSNHFTVAATKTATTALAGVFEREAIRPNVFGRFRDLLVAAEQHPGMILYLDNHISFGPNSRFGRRSGRGLNENLAREILELHTVGVDGGYTQDDVTSFARVLTGWMIAPPRQFPDQAGRFRFIEAAHEPGAHTVMGRRYEQDGIEQPLAVLDDLARHPKTAEHVATKLARHFIADQPPTDTIGRIAAVFRETDGELAAVSTAVVREQAAWDNAQGKIKSPSDYVLSSLRGFRAVDVEPEKIVGSLTLLGQRPFAAPSPAGWPDDSAHWASPDGLMRRIEWAQLVARRLAGSPVEPDELAGELLGALLGDDTRTRVRRAASRTEALALVLTSPEFMRR